MIIYKTTNLTNNKIYIGQTNGKRRSYIGGGVILKQAFNKYGRNNFKHEILIEGNFNFTLTNELEKHYIRLYNSNNSKIGYNIESGGCLKERHHPMKKETKIKIGNSNRGKQKPKFTEEHKLKISLSKKGQGLGIKKSKEFGLSISKAKKGKSLTFIHKEQLRKSKRINLDVFIYNKLYKKYNSYKECQKDLKISINTIKKYENKEIECRVKKYKNYKFIKS